MIQINTQIIQTRSKADNLLLLPVCAEISECSSSICVANSFTILKQKSLVYREMLPDSRYGSPARGCLAPCRKFTTSTTPAASLTS